LHPRTISNALGVLRAAGGAAMLLPAAYSFLSTDGNVAAFGLPALGALALGAVLFFLTPVPGACVSGRDVLLIVVLGWIEVAASLGSLPFIISGLMGPMDAFFEAIAGFTTTGASTIQTLEGVPPSLPLW
jgi:trk system potassium uptake protein